ncbi:L-galactose dehydrogenase-like protein [Plakobranchus ocellatus]|uniref:L-galactose dehydrogenase-like protein n=1 Tax=Plakobranchus ocellatus TaxID=259542 RepID=A0AAV4AKI4_9GAST|nr:L-galactose dehydrogenase-like protein [Plakobranchus ocellatus]
MSLPDTYVEGFHVEDQVKLMPYRPLGETGMVVSALSFGASSLGSVFRSTDSTESVEVVKTCLKAGINYIDTAPWYGQGKSESVLGKVLPSVPRSSFYISTKVGRYELDPTKMFDFSAERTLRSVDESLQRLGLDYVDVIQIHDMEFAPNLDIIVNETLPALQKVKEAGKARFIGITGYPLDNFKIVLECSTVKIDTLLTYCRASMNDFALKEWLPYFKSKKVGVVNASPISMGLLSARGPPAWHPATRHIKDVCKQAAEYCQSQGVDISRLGLRFTLEEEEIPTTLVSTASHANLLKNLQSVYTPLDANETQVLKEVMSKYMEPLQNAHWEGVEVAEYRQKLKSPQEVDSTSS